MTFQTNLVAEEPIHAIGRDDIGRAPRGPRFHLAVDAVLESSLGSARLEVVDIAMGGLKLRGQTELPIGCHCAVRVDGLPYSLCGLIRWKQGDALGFRFDGPMARDNLFTILSCRA